MRRGSVVALLSASAAAIGVVYASAFLRGGAPAFAPWLMIAGLATLLVSAMMLGAARNGRVGVLAVPFALVWLILVGGFGLALMLPAESVEQPWLWLGLPRRAAIVLYGVGLLPLLLMPFAYAFTFDSFTLSEAELTRIRARAREIIAAEHASADDDDAVVVEAVS